ncbi:MAG: methyltransferase domain-containing protein [Cyanobium sp. MAG06]|nr:methyltransferase domain-containing protein [Cyanobium sp. MAG06]
MILNKIIKKSKIKKDSNILDYGFGRGELLIDLYKLGYRQLFGNEISKEAINIFKDNLKKENINEKDFKIKNIKENELFDFNTKLDIVFCKLVYAFISNKKDFLNKIKKSLSNNGALIIFTPVLTKTNQYYISKKNICIKKDDFYLIKKIFPKAIFKLLDKTPSGDRYIIYCYK